MSLPWSSTYAAAAKTGTLLRELPPLDSERPTSSMLAAALDLSPLPPVSPMPPPVIVPQPHDATLHVLADVSFARCAAAAEAVEVVQEEAEAHRGVMLPTPHEVAASVVSTLGEHFGRYSQALLTNQVGKTRLRHVDACSLLGANVHDFDDLRTLHPLLPRCRCSEKALARRRRVRGRARTKHADLTGSELS